LVLDDATKDLVLNAVPEDDILNENVSNIETIESRRQTYKDTSAVYILHSEPYIADCVVADIQRRRYRKLHIVWASRPTSDMRNTIYGAADYAKDMIAEWKVLSIDYLPREGCLALFRDPWSFEVLYNPSCGALVRKHLEELSHKIANICISLGEYPLIRYYRPNHLPHEARVLCPYLAKFVQQALDEYAKARPDFPPPSTRPRSTLYILDRTLDLYAPLIHEFTYQAMVHDLLPIKESDKVRFETTLNQGKPTQEIKDMEISEGDSVWTRHRHLHMKDALPLLVDEFKRFRKDNAAFDER
ncbi:vacuolar sorting protein VPS33/slp1, partial [Ascosphaera atra]